MSIPKPIVPIITVCCILAAWLAWACAPALAGMGVAAPTTCSPPGGFADPVGVAVDDSSSILTKGDFYVTDEGHHTIDQFAPACELLATVEIPGITLGQLTVQDYPSLTEGNVYVAGQSNGTIYQFAPGLMAKTALIKGLSKPTDVTVDEKGDIFVSELGGPQEEGKPPPGSVLEYNAAGEPINAEGKLDANNTIIDELSGPQGLAINQTGTELYVASDVGTVKYTLTGKAYTAAAEPLDAIESHAVTIAPSGDIYVDQNEFGLGEVEQYAPAGGVLLDKFGLLLLSKQSFGIGVDDESQLVYVADSGNNVVYIAEEGATPEAPETETGSEVHGFTALLHGKLKAASNSTGYYFEYNTGASCEDGSRTALGIATEGPVQSEAVELQPHMQYTVCLVATNWFGGTTGLPVSFETPVVAPEIEDQTVTAVGTHSAIAHADVNPENLASRYYIEYGTGSTFTTSPEKTPEVSVGEGATPQAVSAQLVGMEPNTEYRFRIVATNADGDTAAGTEASFTTLPTGTGVLPDNRAYEMVTPAENGNADVERPQAENSTEYDNGIPSYNPFQVALNGSAVTYPVLSFTGVNGKGTAGSDADNQYLAVRSPTGGWTQTLIQPYGYQTSYRAFSSDLSVGVLTLEKEGNKEFEVNSSSAGEPVGVGLEGLYLRSNGGNGYQPLVTSAASAQRSASAFSSDDRVRSGEPTSSLPNVPPSPVFAGGSRDFGDLLFEANDSLLNGNGPLETELQEDVKSEINQGQNANYLYDDIKGRLDLVDVSPEGKVVPDATFGAIPFVKPNGSIVEHESEEGNNPPDFSDVISADGNRVYWTDLTTGVVYLREEGSSTVQVSAGAARYWTASRDGRYAFYTEGKGESSELYRFDAAPAGGQSREILTAPDAGVLGVIGASEDGEDVYFVAEGHLAGENSEGDAPVAGQPNLYMLRHGDMPVFVATLSEEDGSKVAPFLESNVETWWGDWQPGLGQRTARVTGDGNGLLFASNQKLSVVGYPQGYPNGGSDEIYVYNASNTQLYCASCGSTNETLPRRTANAAAFLPVSWSVTTLPQWISEDGNRVFFNSAEPLVAQDTNGVQDVYEWEREGYGSCTHGAGSTGGCVFLLSGGTSEANSWFVGASADGSDAFIVTRAQLVPEDQNDAFDLYDARVGGEKAVAPPVCTGSGCQGVPAPPPTFTTPPSVTFDGVGNFPVPSQAAVKSKGKSLTRAQKLANLLKTCRGEKQRKRRTSCERQAKRRYGGRAKKSDTGSGSAQGRKHV